MAQKIRTRIAGRIQIGQTGKRKADEKPVETSIEDSEKELEQMETSGSEAPAVEDARRTNKAGVEEPADAVVAGSDD